MRYHTQHNKGEKWLFPDLRTLRRLFSWKSKYILHSTQLYQGLKNFKPPQRYNRLTRNWLLFTIIVLFLFSIITPRTNNSISHDQNRKDPETENDVYLPGSNEYQQFMQTVFNIYMQHEIKSYVGTGERLVNKVPELLNKEELLSLMDVNIQFVKEARDLHFSIMKRLPQFQIDLYSGSGYVIVGGHEQYWYAYSLIKILRKLESKYPVEIIIPTVDEYDEYFCKHLITDLNASCVLVNEIFGVDVIKQFSLKNENLEILSILSSSFENVMFLRSYNYPVSLPDELFKSLLLKQNGLILWSDPTRRTTSPYFYSVQGKSIGKVARYKNDLDSDPSLFKNNKNKVHIDKYAAFHDREGTIHDLSNNNGQILINKHRHLHTLLLAFWYQIQGSRRLLSLITQDSTSDATKELFAVAANANNLKYYQVVRDPEYSEQKNALGVPNLVIKWDPVDDFYTYTKIVQDIALHAKNMDGQFQYNYHKFFDLHFDLKPGFALFHDLIGLQMNPLQLYKSGIALDHKGKQVQLLPDTINESINLELTLWQIANDLICVSGSWTKFVDEVIPNDFCKTFIQNRLALLNK
jgi:hypothetical protein